MLLYQIVKDADAPDRVRFGIFALNVNFLRLPISHNTYKYTQLYSSGEPKFVEGDVFRTIIPLCEANSTVTIGPSQNLVTNQVSGQDMETKILNYYKVARSKKEICSYFGYKNLTFFTKKHLMPLLLSDKLKMTIPDKPNSRLQKYIKA